VKIIMTEPKISSVYAQALFELACESDSLENTSIDLLSVTDIFEKNPDFLSLLSLPNISTEEKLDSLKKVFGDDEEDILMNFLCLLTEKNRIGYISEISTDFKRLYNEYNNIEEVTVSTSIPLNESERNKLIVKLQNKLKKRIKLIELIDPSLIGGVRLSYGDTLVDNSIASRISSISRELKNNNI